MHSAVAADRPAAAGCPPHHRWAVAACQEACRYGTLLVWDSLTAGLGCGSAQQDQLRGIPVRCGCGARMAAGGNGLQVGTLSALLGTERQLAVADPTLGVFCSSA